MRSAICGVYKITHRDSERVYVGSSRNIKQRWNDHRSELKRNRRTRKLQSAWNKYGEFAFSFEIIELCAKDQLIAREQYWIDALDAYTKGFNHRPIADRPLGQPWSEERREQCKRIWTPELREVLAASRRGTIMSTETRNKISAANKGKKWSQESRANMREVAKKRGVSDNFRSEEARDKLKASWTPERRAAFAETKRGTKASEETKMKQSLARKGKKMSPEFCATMSEVAKVRGVSPNFKFDCTGMKMSEEAKAKISAAVRARPPMSEETRAKISAGRRRYVAAAAAAANANLT